MTRDIRTSRTSEIMALRTAQRELQQQVASFVGARAAAVALVAEVRASTTAFASRVSAFTRMESICA
jgi:hypothetical protein